MDIVGNVWLAMRHKRPLTAYTMLLDMNCCNLSFTIGESEELIAIYRRVRAFSAISMMGTMLQTINTDIKIVLESVYQHLA